MKLLLLLKICALVGLFTIPTAHASKCDSGVINPISDISWQCIFPIRIGGLSIGKGDSGMPDPGADTPDTVCSCNTGAINRYGLGISMWEPARIIDTVSDPYCIMPLGVKLMNTGGKLGGSHFRNDGQAKPSSKCTITCSQHSAFWDSSTTFLA